MGNRVSFPLFDLSNELLEENGEHEGNGVHPDCWILLESNGEVIQTLYELEFWGSILILHNGQIYFGFMDANRVEVTELMSRKKFDFEWTNTLIHENMQVLKTVGMSLPLLECPEHHLEKRYDVVVATPASIGFFYYTCLKFGGNFLLVDCQEFTRKVFKSIVVVVCREKGEVCTNELCKDARRYNFRAELKHKNLVDLIVKHGYRFTHVEEGILDSCPVIFKNDNFNEPTPNQVGYVDIYYDPALKQKSVPCNYLSKLESIISTTFENQSLYKSGPHDVGYFYKAIDERYIYKSKYLEVEQAIIDFVQEFMFDKKTFMKSIYPVIDNLHDVDSSSKFNALLEILRQISVADIKYLRTPVFLKKGHLRDLPFKPDVNNMLWIITSDTVSFRGTLKKFQNKKFVEYILNGDSQRIVGFEKYMQYSIEKLMHSRSGLPNWEYIREPIFTNDIKLLRLFGTSIELLKFSHPILDRNTLVNTHVKAPFHVIGSIIKLYVEYGIKFTVLHCDQDSLIEKEVLKYRSILVKCVCCYRVCLNELSYARNVLIIRNGKMMFKNYIQVSKSELENCIMENKSFSFHTFDKNNGSNKNATLSKTDYTYSIDDTDTCFMEYNYLPHAEVDRKHVLISTIDQFNINFSIRQNEALKIIEEYPFYDCLANISEIITLLFNVLDIHGDEEFNNEQRKCIAVSLFSILDLLAQNHFGCERSKEISNACDILGDRIMDLRCKLNDEDISRL